MENRNSLVLDQKLTRASGTAEREAALAMLAEQPGERARRSARIRPTIERRLSRAAGSSR
jgi:hypothetical protein